MAPPSSHLQPNTVKSELLAFLSLHISLCNTLIKKKIHMKCHHEHPTNTLSCKVPFSPYLTNEKTGVQGSINQGHATNKFQTCTWLARSSDSRVCACQTPALLTLPRFLCCRLGYELQSYLCHFTMMFHLFKILPPWKTYSYLPKTIHSLLSALCWFFYWRRENKDEK